MSKRKESPSDKDQGKREKKPELPQEDQKSKPAATLHDYHDALLASFENSSFSDIKGILNNLRSDYPRVRLDQVKLEIDDNKNYGLLAVAIMYKTPVTIISSLIDEFKLNF